jgi:adenylate kinase family enzyme
MERVVIFGRAAAGKSSLARTLGEITGLPVIELDKVFWQSGLQPLPPDKWASVQNRLIQNSCWIMDGDLGPYDVIDCRIQAADTIIFLDFPLAICAWRAIRRSRERADFWQWLIAYRRKYRPTLTQAFASHASTATLHRLSNPRAVERFIEDLTGDATLRREGGQ